MRRLILATVLTVLTLGRPARAAGPAAAADAATAARLLALQQAFEALESVQADVVTYTQSPATHTEGRIVLRGPNAYHRVDRVAPDGTRLTAQESIVTADGQWTLNYEIGVATHIDRRRLRAAAPNVTVPNSARDTMRLFAAAAPGSVHYLGPHTKGERTLDQFRVVADVGDGPAGELLVWVDPADGVPRHLELRSPAGRLLLERLYVNVRVNEPVPDALFTVDVPDSLTVHDLTDEYAAGDTGPPAAPPAD